MGMFSKHGNASSTTHSTTWGAQYIEDILMNNQDGPQWYYEDETLAPINDQMQKILNYELSGKGIQNAGALGRKGKSILDAGISDWQKLAGISGQDVLTKWKGMASNAYNGASGFMQTQDQAIEDRVNAEMGSELAQSSEANGSQAAFTSGALNQKSAIVANSAESMETQESAMAMKIARAAASGSASAITSALRIKAGEAGMVSQAGLGIIGTAASLGDKALNNMWQAGAFETAYNQKQTNINRKNNMINNNLPTLEKMQWFQAMEQAQGIDTTSTTNTSF